MRTPIDIFCTVLYMSFNKANKDDYYYIYNPFR